MHSAGFTHQMVSVTRSNRLLLKGDKSGTYQNFDKSYITDYIISRKRITWKKTSPEYLRQLRRKLMTENRRASTVRMIVFLLAVFVVTGIFAMVFIS